MSNDTAVIKLRSAAQIEIDKRLSDLADDEERVNYALSIAQGSRLKFILARMDAIQSSAKALRELLAELQHIEDRRVAALERLNRYRLQHQPCTKPIANKEE